MSRPCRITAVGRCGDEWRRRGTPCGYPPWGRPIRGDAHAAVDEVNHLLQMELKRTLTDFSQQDAICAGCPDRQLCAKRILLVGGITRLRAIYQLTVEEMGGEFRYHDGRSNNGDRELVGMIGWADIVLCPVDVNSHNACLSVKKACKRLKKPYHMLLGSGVSSIARALTTYCSPAIRV